jgi:hypothetical protein
VDQSRQATEKLEHFLLKLFFDMAHLRPVSRNTMDRVLIIILVLLLLLGFPGLLLVRQAEMHRACTATLESYVTDGNERHPKAGPVELCLRGTFR